jgi:hypothetical protein
VQFGVGAGEAAEELDPVPTLTDTPALSAEQGSWPPMEIRGSAARFGHQSPETAKDEAGND